MNALSRPIRGRYDVAVIGAGPAGLAAAAACARAGLETVLFDEQPAPGGQIYRAITETPLLNRAVLGEPFWRGAELVDAFNESGAQFVPGATVWSLTREREIGVSVGGGSSLTHARRVIICTGALERPFPIGGWTLPGVMTAGAAQILLKASGLVASGRTVLAGCGPLLWLLAWQYLNAGAKIEAILDTTPGANPLRALPHAAGFLSSRYFPEGLKLLRRVKREVRVIRGVTDLRAIGDGYAQRVEYRCGGAAERLDVDTLLLHQGVVPNVNLAMAAGIEHRWHDDQLCWVPKLDVHGNSSIEGIAMAGDGAGIAGADAARWRGMIAAHAALRALGHVPKRGDEKRALRMLRTSLKGRRFLDAYYKPARAFRQPEGDTIVCRCEEVTAREIVETVKLGCQGPNQMKAFLRCGMGPCQGRLCGLTVTELIAEHRGVPPQGVGYYRLRPPVKPITVGEVAKLPQTEAAVKAVVRS
ncbi:MAG: FAD/NAD(P)-dependent oxidoreductase [Burkholderiales bacterium]